MRAVGKAISVFLLAGSAVVSALLSLLGVALIVYEARTGEPAAGSGIVTLLIGLGGGAFSFFGLRWRWRRRRARLERMRDDAAN